MNDIAQMLRDNILTSTLIDSLSCGIIVVDEEGRVQALNNVVENVVGVTEQVVKGKGGGDTLGCVHASESANGCGTADCCNDCEFRMLALGALNGNKNKRAAWAFNWSSTVWSEM